jgi:hypothetical protein
LVLIGNDDEHAYIIGVALLGIERAEHLIVLISLILKLIFDSMNKEY